MLLSSTAPAGRSLLRHVASGSGRSTAALACTSRRAQATAVAVGHGVCAGRAAVCRLSSNTAASSSRGDGGSSTGPDSAAASAVAAAVTAAVIFAQQRLRQGGEEEEGGHGACLCKSKPSAQDSLQDYARRLSKLRSLRDIFEEYATVNADDVGQLMTCGDFLRAMLCYKYVRVDDKELKRRCARYFNPLLGDEHGLISFNEFCFLLGLLSIPAGLFDVAFSAADVDGSGTIEVEELERLVKRLAPSEDGDDNCDEDSKESGGGADDKGGDEPRLTGHKRLAAAWFGEGGEGGEGRGERGGKGGGQGDGGGGGKEGGRGVPREQFASFVRDLRMDVKTVECRLYSRSIRLDKEDEEGSATARRGWLRWLGLGGGGGTPASKGARDDGGGDSGTAAAGWWSRYEYDTISMADLALTLVSTCHPRDMPVFLARVQAIQKKRKQIPLRDALLLHEVLEDHAQDLEDALGMYSKASSGGAVQAADFARAAKVISGKELSPECVWLVFKMFDRGGDGRLEHDELIEATRERLRQLPGQRDSPGKIASFVQCVRGE